MKKIFLLGLIVFVSASCNQINQKKKSTETNSIQQQTTKSIKNNSWKTYTNSRVGFELNYPPNYKIQEGRGEDINVTIIGPSIRNPELEFTDDSSDSIYIKPRESLESLKYFLPEPIQMSERYFTSKNVADNFNIYLGKIITSSKTGFSVYHSKNHHAKLTFFDNNDGTFFVIQGGYLFSRGKDELTETKASEIPKSFEPYDSIVKSLVFGKRKLNKASILGKQGGTIIQNNVTLTLLPGEINEDVEYNLKNYTKTELFKLWPILSLADVGNPLILGNAEITVTPVNFASKNITNESYSPKIKIPLEANLLPGKKLVVLVGNETGSNFTELDTRAVVDETGRFAIMNTLEVGIILLVDGESLD